MSILLEQRHGPFIFDNEIDSDAPAKEKNLLIKLILRYKEELSIISNYQRPACDYVSLLQDIS